MLNFFRKYQKFFFIIITVMVVSSFVFFGTSGAMVDTPQRVDRVIGKSIDGSDLNLLEISALSRFLSSDREDIAGGGTPNLLNDGVIRRDLIGTGVAEILVRESFDLLKGEFSQKLQRIKSFRSYEHPDAPFVSAKAIWQRFAPDINKEWSALQSAEEVTGESFNHISRLYQLQSSLPSEYLRRILMMHEQQYKQWLKPDPRLKQDDLALFGFHSLNDWFGKDFVDLMAEFIHNAAIAAEDNGYWVSMEEAKADMKRVFVETMQKLQESKWPNQFSYKDQLRMLGMDETEAATVWRKVLLFRRYFQDIGESMFLDRLPYTQFASVAKEKATVDLFKWSEVLKLKNDADLYALQTYIESVAPKTADILAFPTAILSIAEVEQKAPELVATQYTAKVFAIDKREVGLRASLKEVWEFETQDANWDKLKKEFTFLGAGKTRDERFKQLEKLDPMQRSKVDLLARRLLVDLHPEWVTQALDAAEPKLTKLALCNGKIHMPYVDKPEKLGSLFAQMATSKDAAIAALSHFETGEGVLRFENIEKISDASIKTFQEALADGSVHRMVDKIMEAKFSKLKAKLPAEKADKQLSEVKNEIATLLLKDLKKAVEGSSIEADLPAQRMAALATRAREELMTNANDPKWIKQENDSPLLAQFKLERVEKQITRTAEESWMTKEPFILAPNHWSTVHVGHDGGVVFLCLKSREMATEPVSPQLTLGKEMLVADVQRLLAEKIFSIMQKKHSIVIPLQNE